MRQQEPKTLLGAQYERVGESAIALNDKQVAVRDALNARIASGESSLAPTPCPCAIAGAGDTLLATSDKYGMVNHVVVCDQCGLVRANPRMQAKAYAQFYAHEYRLLYGGTAKPGGRFELMRARRAGSAQWIRRAFSLANKTVLEIGAGGGWLLDHLRHDAERVVGYDYNDVYLDLGRSRGIDLRSGGVDEALKSDERYDLIVLSQVLEHMLDPIVELTRLRALLAPGGQLYIGVPGLLNPTTNPMGLMRHFQAAHVYYFSATSLQCLVQQAGFSVLSIDESIQSLWYPCEGSPPPVRPNLPYVQFLMDRIVSAACPHREKTTAGDGDHD